jgi:hypothetical protein
MFRINERFGTVSGISCSVSDVSIFENDLWTTGFVIAVDEVQGEYFPQLGLGFSRREVIVKTLS